MNKQQFKQLWGETRQKARASKLIAWDLPRYPTFTFANHYFWFRCRPFIHQHLSPAEKRALPF
jgi:hypothetical protein